MYELGVKDMVIQAILRYADVAVTRKHYIKTSTAQAEAAMTELAKAWKRVNERISRKSHPLSSRQRKASLAPFRHSV